MNLERQPKQEKEPEEVRLFAEHKRGSLEPIPAGTIGEVVPYPNPKAAEEHVMRKEVVVRFKDYGEYFVKIANLYPRDD